MLKNMLLVFKNSLRPLSWSIGRSPLFWMGFHWQALGRRTQVLGIRTWSPELPLWSAWVHRQHWKPCRPQAAAAQQQQQQALAATNELLSDLMGFFTAESPFFGRMYVQPMRHRDVDAWRSNGDLELFHHINHSKPAVFLVINTYFLEFQAPFLDAVGFFSCLVPIFY